MLAGIYVDSIVEVLHSAAETEPVLVQPSDPRTLALGLEVEPRTPRSK
jgi:hypothetical protein